MFCYFNRLFEREIQWILFAFMQDKRLRSFLKISQNGILNVIPKWYNFLVNNDGEGPFGAKVPIERVLPGDILQFRNDKDVFQHTPVITEIRGRIPSVNNIYVAAHSYDCACRPLSSYIYEEIRFIHIEGVRFEESRKDQP